MNAAWNNVRPYLPEPVGGILAEAQALNELDEIRIRLEKPLMVGCGGRDFFVGGNGKLLREETGAYRVGAEAFRRVADALMRHSPYALEDELRAGYVALPGGVRIGLAGRLLMENGAARTMTDISGLNIRLPRQVMGCGREILPSLLRGGRLLHTLIVSPPLAGKTTLLRDLVRLASRGEGCAALRVTVVDERSELAGCYAGRPQFDLGPRTDVLDSCPKSRGMMMALRSLAPQAVATDEIGGAEDAQAIREVARAGATVLTTAHADGYDALLHRADLRSILDDCLFERYVVLGMRPGPGAVLSVRDGKGRLLMGVSACRARESTAR